MCQSTIMCERPNLNQNKVFRSSSQTLPLMLDSSLVEIFLEAENELLLIKKQESKVDFHRRHHCSVMALEIDISLEVAAE